MYNVLLLNSYHKGFLWTDEITRGVEETFKGLPIDLHIEYLDTKRFFNEEYFDKLEDMLAFKHKSFHYSAVVISDNNAFEFFRERGREIFGDIPAVFCGYNYLDTADLQGISNITGINEKADIEKNLKLIEAIHPHVSEIIILSDITVTGRQIVGEVEKLMAQREESSVPISLVYDISSSDLKEFLSHVDEDAIVYMTVFFRDRNGVFFEYDEGTQMISEASPVPVYGAWDFQLGQGIVGGHLVEGFDQGREAAEKVIQILNGVSIDSIPVLMETPVKLFFDYEVLNKFGINIYRLPQHRTIVNWPETFFLKYRIQIAVTLSLIVLLTMAFLAVLYGFILSRKAEKEVRNHEEDLRTTLYSIGDGVITTDLAQKIVRMNPVAEVLTGYQTGEVEGKPISEIFRIHNALTGEAIENPVAQVLRDGKITLIPRHSALISKEGREYMISDSAAPIHDDHGEVTGVVLVFRNITEEYRIQEELIKERNYVRRIINNSPSLICGLDLDGTAIFINPVIEKITGYREEEIIGKNFWKHFYPGEEFQQIRQLLEDSKEGVVIDYEMTLTCKNGEKRQVVWNSFNRKDTEGNTMGYMGFGYDITSLKKAEKQLYEANLELVKHKDNLEELVAERTLELQISLEHLQQTQNKLVESEKMAALGGLVAGVAHEVNTPVGIGVTAASHLEETVEDFLKLYKEGKVTKQDFEKFVKLCSDSAQMILSNMKRAGELIQSFKQVAVDQSSQEIRKFLICSYIDEILLSLHAQYRNKGIAIEVNCPENIHVTTNPGALSQIMTNLIMNSIIHGFEDLESGTITIDIRKSDDNVLIIYGDTGKGIPGENLQKIFEPFFTTKRGLGGSGLGMNIVYNLVTQTLGGEISCTSQPGEGTWFEIEFPRKLEREA